MVGVIDSNGSAAEMNTTEMATAANTTSHKTRAHNKINPDPHRYVGTAILIKYGLEDVVAGVMHSLDHSNLAGSQILKNKIFENALNNFGINHIYHSGVGGGGGGEGHVYIFNLLYLLCIEHYRWKGH